MRRDIVEKLEETGKTKMVGTDIFDPSFAYMESMVLQYIQYIKGFIDAVAVEYPHPGHAQVSDVALGTRQVELKRRKF